MVKPLTSPPSEWLELKNVSVRAANALEIMNGKEKGGLWHALYLLFLGDMFEADVSNRYRHELSKPFYNAAKMRIKIEQAKNDSDATQEYIDYLERSATTQFLSGTGFRNSKRSKSYSNSDLQYLFDYECMLNEQEFEDGTIDEPRTMAEIYRRIAEHLDLSENHVKREILNLNKKIHRGS